MCSHSITRPHHSVYNLWHDVTRCCRITAAVSVPTKRNKYAIDTQFYEAVSESGIVACYLRQSYEYGRVLDCLCHSDRRLA